MKSFQVAALLLVASVALVSAEPPRFRSNRFRFQRQEQEPTPLANEEGSASDAPYPPAMQAPYAPSGWKPSGRLFALPARQQQEPKDTYGPPPPQVYGPPSQVYGTPEVATEEAPVEQEQTTTAAPEEEEINVTAEAVATAEEVEGENEAEPTTEPLSETVDVEVDDKAQEQEQQPQSERLTQAGGPGFYYVQLPQLQQQQQQYIVAPQAQRAQLKALPLTAAAPVSVSAPAQAFVAQPFAYANQPLVYSSGYYVAAQPSW